MAFGRKGPKVCHRFLTESATVPGDMTHDLTAPSVVGDQSQSLGPGSSSDHAAIPSAVIQRAVVSNDERSITESFTTIDEPFTLSSLNHEVSVILQ